MLVPKDKSTWLPFDFEPGLISVVIPVFNRAHVIGETIGSVFRQTYHPIEIIVADDCSSDGTEEVVKALQKPACIELRFIHGPKGGSCVARNRGAAESHGEFVMFLDSDDLLTPRTLELLRQRISASAVDMAWGPWRELKCLSSFSELSPVVQRDFAEDWMSVFLRGQFIATCSVLYRREVLHRIKGWDESTALDCDYRFNAELGVAGATLAGIEEVTAYYRKGVADQMSETAYVDQARHIRIVLQLMEKLHNDLGLWTADRRAAIAWRYFHAARESWIHSRAQDLFLELVADAHRVDANFRPPNRWYSSLARVFGYRNAERVAAMRRELFR